MSLTFKAFLYERTWRGDPVEIRRFTVDQDVSSSYAYLVEKVVQVFPSLTPNNFILAWTDADGDVITISSDQELVEALDQFEGNIFRLLLKRKPGSASAPSSAPTESIPPGGDTTQDPPADAQSSAKGEAQESFHPGVQCDGCNGPIYGTRFKCLVCRDYDLCSRCEGKGVHVDHNMLSIADPYSYHPWGFPQCPRGRFGPFRGRGGCGRFGGRPYRCPGGSFPGGQGWFSPWWQGFGTGAASCQGNQCGEKTKNKGEGEESMDTEQKPGPSEEERKTFLRGVGEAVSSFLEPFGVKVDVDVVPGAEKPGQTTTTSDTPAAADQTSSEVSDEVIEEALTQLRSMGYQDEGGWLMELVRAKGGDVAKVLDALHPSVEQD